MAASEGIDRKIGHVSGEEADAERWVTLAREVSSQDRTSSSKIGSLTIIGSGIKSVSHFTLESLSELKSANDVFFCVADPVTERFIKRLRPDALDLYVLYDDDKKRIVTYVQMAEFGLHQARKGRHVCMVFYGHGGVFVLPSQRALHIAKKEGIPTKMLAAVSTETCLFADLAVDPSIPGLQTLEATDFLIRNRPINTDFHVVIWQVGCVGDIGFRRKGYHNDHFNILIEKLQEIYGKDYEIIHYIPAHYPIASSKVRNVALCYLLNPEEMKQVTGVSTFYIPPKTSSQLDIDMALKLGIIREDSPAKSLRPGHRVIDAYTDKEKQYIRSLADWEIPTEYSYAEETELSNILTDLSLNPVFLRHCKEKGYPKLSDKTEDDALNSGNHARIRHVLKPSTTVKQAQTELAEQHNRSKGCGQTRKPSYLRKSYIPKHIKPVFVFNDSDDDDDDDKESILVAGKTAVEIQVPPDSKQ
ncbi:uncharacterized protein LOC132548816 [Ylistrum balloti]|uniref:uncharacterized protein LOC132548816 n=1 Tax=Ylistrum balloti TaxID=509963 RepID=UPI0029059DCF|nr:uncharacterized protein LOC132548816 [Ylistrum balloti]